MKKIVLGVTGAIAAYKVCSLVRLMVGAGWQVRVVATAEALNFVGEVTWETLSQHRVEKDGASGGFPPRHIELAQWCDAMVIAPLSANTLAKVAHGLGDNLLTQTVLAYPGKLFVAPSMNAQMWANAATQANVETLIARGVQVLAPGEGELACGVTGAGRLPEPEAIFKALEEALG